MTTPEPERPPDPPKDLPGALTFLTMGFTIFATVGAFVALGAVADGYLKTSPLCLLLGIGIGLAVATISTIALVRRYL